MDFDLFDNTGCPLGDQRFTWRELVQEPISKLDDDAFTRVRVILMNGIETDALRFKHIAARGNHELRMPLADIRRVEQHQATLVNSLLLGGSVAGRDHHRLRAGRGRSHRVVAQNEPNQYLAQAYRFGPLEDFDHLYRYSAMLDRLEGKDANNIRQGYTDIIPGRPTAEEHRAPEDDVREPYPRDAAPISKINAMLITASEYQTHDYYMNIGPLFADPVARQLYAEIASIEEQHVTQYGSLINPDETWLEHWLLHEAMEVYAYWSCMEQEQNPRIKALWERFVDYELGHFHAVADLMRVLERRDPRELFFGGLPNRIEFKSHRELVQKVLAEEVDLRARGAQYVARSEESEATLAYRRHINSQGSPSSIVSAGYCWGPGSSPARS
jgi:hypothetical protein